MKDSTRNALALFAIGIFMLSISPLFVIYINYDELSSILPPVFANFLEAEQLRWGSMGIGLIAIILGLLTFFYYWNRK